MSTVYDHPNASMRHRWQVKVFMALKNDERAKLKAEEAAKKKVTGEEQRKNAEQAPDPGVRRGLPEAQGTLFLHGRRPCHSVTSTCRSLARKWSAAKTWTSSSRRSSRRRSRNFALFNYVNELNADVEKLQDEIKTMHEDIAKTKTEEETQDSGRSTLIKHLEVALQHTYRYFWSHWRYATLLLVRSASASRVNAETQQAETELTKINQTLDELKSALEKIFKLLECNARSD